MQVTGTVFRVNSGNYHVQTQADGVVICKLRGNLKKELIYSTSSSRPRRVQEAQKRRATDPIAVGDRVRVSPDLRVIEEVLPRTSELSRDSPSQRGQHTLVANVDQIFVVFAATEPNPDLWLMDRFLVMAEAADIAARIVINKIDLLEGVEEGVRRSLSVYERAGYQVNYVSARAGIGIDALHQALTARISAVAGPSGVGKSRLLNALCPGAQLKVGDIGTVTHKGRHTTTSAELIPCGEGGDSWIADTPGLRQVDFWQVDKDEIRYCFPELAPYLPECRFADCRHQEDELGCAVLAAVQSGKIDRRRYDSFREMTRE